MVNFMVVVTCLSGGTDVYNANMIWERIKAYHGRASESVRPVNRVHGQGWEWPTPASGGMEDGRSRYVALTFPIIAVLCGKIKEQCLEREGRVGKFGFVGELGFLVAGGSGGEAP